MTPVRKGNHHVQQKKKKAGERSLPFQLLSGIILFLFIVSASVTFTLQLRPLYYADIRILDISENTGIDEETIKKNYDILIDYNTLGNRSELVLPDFSMSEGGRIHFQEVKVIFDFISIVLIITGPLTLILILYSRKSRNFLYLAVGGVISLAVPALLTVLLFADWGRFFVGFHHLFFNNDYWIFDPAQDPVINILPDTFFLHCALLILILVILGGIISLLFYRKLRRLH